jgi:hypothetical protein
MIRTYSKLKKFGSLLERYNYLRLSGIVGKETFGYDRLLNQDFYRSREWKRIRDIVIIRDEACDLGILDFPIGGKILIHHMNPVTVESIKTRDRDILNPEFLIATSERTHQAIHYGDSTLLPYIPIIRKINDTKLW